MSNQQGISSALPRFEPGEWCDGTGLATADLDADIRRWLTSGGLLTKRLHALLNVELRALAETGVTLSSDERLLLKCTDKRGRLREISLEAGGIRYVYAASLMPDTLLHAHPWLEALGAAPLGPTLAARLPAARSEFCFRRLDPAEPLAQRATSEASCSALWARRSTFRLPGGLILVSEVFLPALAGWRF